MRGFPVFDSAGEVEVTSIVTSQSRATMHQIAPAPAQGLSLAAQIRGAGRSFIIHFCDSEQSTGAPPSPPISRIVFSIDHKLLRLSLVQRSMSLFEEDFFSISTNKTDNCNNFWGNYNQDFQDISDVITADCAATNVPEMSLNLEVPFFESR